MVKELVEELRDRVTFLERSPEQRSVEAEHYQQIVAGLTQTNNRLSTRVLELEGPPPSPTSSWASEGTAQDVAEAAASPKAPRASTTSSESDPGTEPLRRSGAERSASVAGGGECLEASVDEIVVRMNLQVVPRHPFISRLPFLLPRDRVYRASSALIGLANIVQKGHAATDVMRRHREVRVNLGIDP